MVKTLIVVLALCSFSAATTRYIAQSAGVFGGGTACNGQTAITPATWNGLSLAAGDLTWVCGTVTGSAGVTLLTVPNSGSAGNPITLKFDTGAIVQAPYGPSAAGGSAGGIISANAKSFIIIDGNSLAGTIQNTLNGAPGATCPGGACNSQHTSTLIDFQNCTSCTFQNVNLLNTYVELQNAASENSTNEVAFIGNGSNMVFSGNVVANCGWCVELFYANGETNYQTFNNVFTFFGHAYAFAAAGTGACTAPCFFMHDNQMAAGVNWDAAGCPNHKDGIHLYGSSPSTMDGVYLYNNLFNGDWGLCPTGFIFAESGVSDPGIKSWWIWNNVGVVVNTSFVNSNGWMNMSSGHSGTQFFLNNTLIGNGQSDNTYGFVLHFQSALTFEDNTASGVGNPVDFSTVTLTAADYNVYGANVCQNLGNCFVWNGSFEGSFATWKTACSCDSHSISNLTPNLNADGSPQSNFVGIKEGINLGSIASGNLATLQNDTTEGNSRVALVRPSAGTCSAQGSLPCWDIGAYQFANSVNPGSIFTSGTKRTAGTVQQ